ncbi:von Willebrand factor type A domain containing protein [Nitzschia inconspicua]|uniref:von Willebrand factor type A domain containing protein n=1 Tax=Nitzschia inconspicua TaxID=303405 RepID=A0A9K3KCI8_9STRA|nr:von Willebrand factor type A domain containing protein [Nitzschia inconspicua]
MARTNAVSTPLSLLRMQQSHLKASNFDRTLLVGILISVIVYRVALSLVVFSLCVGTEFASETNLDFRSNGNGTQNPISTHSLVKSSRGLRQKQSSSKSSKSFKSTKKSKKNNNNVDKRTLPPPAEGMSCESEATLPTGAVLSVNLDLSGIEPLDPAPLNRNSIRRALQDDVSQIGRVHISEGAKSTKFAHFTYLIDVSLSTVDNACDETRNILECQIQALSYLNQKIAQAKVAFDVSLVSFAGTATTRIELADPADPRVDAAIVNLMSEKSTNFQNGLLEAISQVEKSKTNNPNVSETYIVFLTDGGDMHGFLADNIIPRLSTLGTKVFAFATGDNSNCSPELHKLTNSTGTTCKEVKEVTELENVLEQVFLSPRAIESVVVTVDGVDIDSRTEPTIPPGGVLPDKAPINVMAAPSNLIPKVLVANSSESIEASIFNITPEGNATIIDRVSNDTVVAFANGYHRLLQGRQTVSTPFEICLSGTSRTDVARCCVNVTAPA